ncbi:MAG: cadherin-like domain-containing protein [Planctomycetes bacterium]|nr:cadherin-like domain-containing protein [Planctomycetota bacterium]
MGRGHYLFRALSARRGAVACTCAAAAVCCASPVLGATVRVKPWATYLRTSTSDPRTCDPCRCDPTPGRCDPCNCRVGTCTSATCTSCACPIRLRDYGILPGDRIRLRRLGDFTPASDWPDDQTGMAAVFSSTNELLPQDFPHRVPGALEPTADAAAFDCDEGLRSADCAADVATPPTLEGQPTDIPEDFLVTDLVLRVPESASYLFVTAIDSYFADNNDPLPPAHPAEADFLLWFRRLDDDDFAPGDTDFDGDIDLADAAQFQRCFGPGRVPQSRGCCLDYDDNGQTDWLDIPYIACAIAGPRNAWQRGCGRALAPAERSPVSRDHPLRMLEPAPAREVDAAAEGAPTEVAARNALQAYDAEFLVPRNTRVRLHLAGFDADGDRLTFTLVQNATSGGVGSFYNTGNQTARVNYYPRAGFEGEATFRFQVSDGTTASAPATVRLVVQKLLVPWLEVEGPQDHASVYWTPGQGADPDMTQVDYCLRGLEAWAQVTDTAIVTTRQWKCAADCHPCNDTCACESPCRCSRPCNCDDTACLYEELERRKPPGMRIIGGVETSAYLDACWPATGRPCSFADPAVWARIAEDVRRIAEATGVNIVALDNEDALNPFVQGAAVIDAAALHAALAPLAETGVVTWSYLPWVMSDHPTLFPDRHDRSCELVRAVAAALPQHVFMAGYSSYSGWRDYAGEIDRHNELCALVSGAPAAADSPCPAPDPTACVGGVPQVVDGMFVKLCGFETLRRTHSSGVMRRTYSPARALSELPYLQGDAVRIYPGGTDWVLVARSFAALLPPLATPLR